MFSLTVSDHVMVAHSFKGAEFGPAQRVHGATFVVEAEFRAPRLDRLNIIVDIGLARRELRRALDTLDYRNLDEEAGFAGQNTTTEFLAAHIHGQLRAALREGRFGAGGAAVRDLKVTLRESPNAWAAFEGPVADAPEPEPPSSFAGMGA
jgi:6-pyruvoyl-tetrahydropterin synthase